MYKISISLILITIIIAAFTLTSLALIITSPTNDSYKLNIQPQENTKTTLSMPLLTNFGLQTNTQGQIPQISNGYPILDLITDRLFNTNKQIQTEPTTPTPFIIETTATPTTQQKTQTQNTVNPSITQTPTSTPIPTAMPSPSPSPIPSPSPTLAPQQSATSDSPQLPPAGSDTYYDGDNGKSVTINKGDTLQIRLQEDSTRYYTWYIDTTDGLQVVGDNFYYIPRYAPGGVLVGVPGTRIFDIKATKLGLYKIKATYKSLNDPVASEYGLTVDVVE
jgi:predicted secreted protein